MLVINFTLSNRLANLFVVVKIVAGVVSLIQDKNYHQN